MDRMVFPPQSRDGDLLFQYGVLCGVRCTVLLALVITEVKVERFTNVQNTASQGQQES